MKTFEQLTKMQRLTAINSAFYSLVSHISEGTVDITLADPENQKRLESILTASRKRESLRLGRLFILANKPVRKEIYRLAVVAAANAYYLDDGSPFMETVDETCEYIAQ